MEDEYEMFTPNIVINLRKRVTELEEKVKEQDKKIDNQSKMILIGFIIVWGAFLASKFF